MRRVIFRIGTVSVLITLILVIIKPTGVWGQDRDRQPPNWDQFALPQIPPPGGTPHPPPVISSYTTLQAQLTSPTLTYPAGWAIPIIVELQEQPAVNVIGGADLNSVQAAQATQAQITRVEAAQRSTLNAMTAAGIPYRTVFTLSRVMSALIIETTPDQLNAIQHIAGVKTAYVAGVGTIANADSIPFVGAPDVWTTPGFNGQGITVGIIDTGIDYEHADFGGTGPGTTFPTVKVAGGYDFVGDAWDPDTNPTLNPDADPLDQHGHGTHMAGTTAGYGVDAGGNTYTGPWDNTTPFGSMLIGPGMAPEATLYALKVSGAGDRVSEAGVIAALEWASDPNNDKNMSDHLDVVNLSLGSYYGSPWRGWTQAANDAAQIGVIVVAAATNAGDAYFSQGDPATADWAISVAASTHDGGGSAQADMIASLSSRGPQRQTNAASISLKPDITVPGANIVSARAGTVTGSVGTTGTSAASAHIAGMMALLREAYPAWSVAELKALVMNTATHDLYAYNGQTPPIYGPGRVGAGRLDAPNAVNSNVIAYNAAHPELVSISFGVINAVGPVRRQQIITVKNKGNSPLTYAVAYVPVVQMDDDDGSASPGVGDGGAGVTMSHSPAQVTVNPGRTATIIVTLDVNPALMTRPHTHDATVGEALPFTNRHWLSEESGYVTLTPTTQGAGSTLLRVPVYAAPRPAAAMHEATNVIPVTDVTGTAAIPLTGTEVYTGPTFPYDETSLVSAFELHTTSANIAHPAPDYNAADLWYVGLANTYAQTSDLNTTNLYFGIATYGEWSSLSDAVRFDVYIDVNQDTIADYRLWNDSLANLFFGDPSDEYFVFLDNLNNGVGFDNVEGFVNVYPTLGAANFPDTVLFQTNVLFMQLQVAHIPELTAGNAQFDYWVAASYKDQVVDVSPIRTVDVESVGLDVTGDATFWGASLYDDWQGATIDVTYDLALYTTTTLPCVLLLHHHNAAARAETVCFTRNTTGGGDTDQDTSANVTSTTATSATDIASVTELPATGYARTEPSPAARPVHGWLIEALALLIMIAGGVLVKRYMQN
ncbi:MAG: S8 family serine peptidase [Anaerolineae bacterium]|nr:S8 family serine peptidase [Anaerolineae bacterium]